MSHKTWLLPTVTFALGSAAAIEAYAEVFMSEEQAVRMLFPNVKMEPRTLATGDSERAEIRLWHGTKGTVMVDRVLGKHEMITYAVGLDSKGVISGLEILEYRENYGGQIRRSSWRSQFIGKSSQSPLKLDQDIQNVSGATLSSAHVTMGVKRLLQIYDKIKDRL